MRKLIATINMTLDGYCDHTAGIPDEQLHQHYTEIINRAGAILYGRVTYQLMESFWPALAKNPTGEKAMDDFALAIHHVHKIVFSRTLNHVEWQNTTLAKKDLQEEVLDLKKQSGSDILVGSPGLISSLTKLQLFDEYQLCIHPVIAGSGLTLFKNIDEKIILKLLKTKIFNSGAVIHYYEPSEQKRSL